MALNTNSSQPRVHRKLNQLESGGQVYAVDAEEFVDGLVCVAVPMALPGSRVVRCALALGRTQV